jgi:O-succinylbenzoic acid--CoA ligase
MNIDKAEAFKRDWENGQETFAIMSSGSTGEPKIFRLHKNWMQWSAARTAEFIRPAASDKILCSLPVDKVGGIMMLARAIEWEIPVDVTEPSINPLLNKSDASIISLTPFQLYHVIINPVSLYNLLHFREVLVGGGEISHMLNKAIMNFKTDTVFRHSYGMTETYSHIALRKMNGADSSEWFSPFRDVTVSPDESSCATIQTPFYPEGLVTNDIISQGKNGQFKILGRKDFIINSGGVKLQAEQIEQKIYEETGTNIPFVISSKKDEALGNRLVLVCENKDQFERSQLLFLQAISPYAVPKEIIELNPLPLNEGGKIDRLKISGLINR